MAKTVGEILDLVDEIVPNRINSTTKVKFLNDILMVASRYNTDSIVLNTTGTIADTQTYDLPSGTKVEDILWLGLSNSTFSSTDISAASTTVYTEYKFKGIEDPESGLRYFVHSTQLGLIPVPDDAYYLRIEYNPYLGPFSSTASPSSDSTTILNINSYLINYVQDKLCSKICKSVSFPRLDLANNYELDSIDSLDQAKLHYYKTLQARSKRNISYKRWW